MERHIVMLCSLDTKGPEAAYLRDCIQELGAHTIMIDIGYGRRARIDADISASDLASAAGSDIANVRAMNDTGAASALIMQGGIIRVQELLKRGLCDAVISFGGASNATLATGVMKTLPLGIPKLVISSAAALPAYSAKFFGSRDITMMHAVVDISGLNDITRAFLKRGAGAICGMAAASDGAIDPSGGSRMVAVTSFRFAEECSQHVMRELERLGYNPIPFHAQGVGENAFENLVRQGLFLGVVDIVPAGLSERMLGGNRAARPDRLEAAGRAGVPAVIAPSGFDMISCGPIDRRDQDDPLWKKLDIANRAISVPDAFRVEARTTAAEVESIARKVAEKLNRYSSPVSLLIPLRGWSSLSVEGRDLHDPEADSAFAATLKETLDPRIPVAELDEELNSEPFARALVSELHRLIMSMDRAAAG